MGADDFLSKPVEEKLLIAKTKVLSELSILRSKVRDLKSIVQKLKEEPNLISDIDRILVEEQLLD